VGGVPAGVAEAELRLIIQRGFHVSNSFEYSRAKPKPECWNVTKRVKKLKKKEKKKKKKKKKLEKASEFRNVFLIRGSL
jgi:hypothetical protein